MSITTPANKPVVTALASQHLSDFVGQKGWSNGWGLGLNYRGRAAVADAISQVGADMRRNTLIVKGDLNLLQQQGLRKRFAIQSLPPATKIQGRLRLEGCRNLRGLDTVVSLQALSVRQSALQKIEPRLVFVAPADLNEPQLNIDSMKQLASVNVENVRSVKIGKAQTLQTLSVDDKCASLTLSHVNQLQTLQAELAGDKAELTISDTKALEHIDVSKVGKIEITKTGALQKLKIGQDCKALYVSKAKQLQKVKGALAGRDSKLELKELKSLASVQMQGVKHVAVHSAPNLARVKIGKDCSTLDISKAKELDYLKAGLNEGASVRLAGLKELTTLKFGAVQRLDQVAIAQCTRLKHISASKLTTVDALNINKCTALRRLPKQLTSVQGEANLMGLSKLKALPKGFTVAQDCNLSRCTSLRSLPKGFETGKQCDLSKCRSMRSLPVGFKVGQNLQMRGTWRLRPLKSPLISVGGYIKGISSLTRLQLALQSKDKPKLLKREPVDVGKNKPIMLWKVPTQTVEAPQAEPAAAQAEPAAPQVDPLAPQAEQYVRNEEAGLAAEAQSDAEGSTQILEVNQESPSHSLHSEPLNDQPEAQLSTVITNPRPPKRGRPNTSNANQAPGQAGSSRPAAARSYREARQNDANEASKSKLFTTRVKEFYSNFLQGNK